LVYQAEKEMHILMENGVFKKKIVIDRHGPRLMPNNYQHLDTPNFSLPNTFKQWLLTTVFD
jgi:hypothetical protein